MKKVHNIYFGILLVTYIEKFPSSQGSTETKLSVKIKLKGKGEGVQNHATLTVFSRGVKTMGH